LKKAEAHRVAAGAQLSQPQKASIKGGTPTADVEEPVQAVAREVLSLGAGAQKSREAASTSANPEV
jgi:hypothetical protein